MFKIENHRHTNSGFITWKKTIPYSAYNKNKEKANAFSTEKVAWNHKKIASKN